MTARTPPRPKLESRVHLLQDRAEGHDRLGPEAAGNDVRSDVCFARLTGNGSNGANPTLVTPCMVRPCGARDFLDLADAVLHQCIRSLIGAYRGSRPTWISARVRPY